MSGRVRHPTDFSKSTGPAFARAVAEARQNRSELLLIHGIADDNVYVAHSLRMTKALMEAGRRHAMIPLSGITHRPVDPAAAEAMLGIEVEFLHRALGAPGAGEPPG